MGIAAGVASTVDGPRLARSAIQVTPLCGPIYARFQRLLDGNFAFEVGVALKIPIVVSWGP